MSSSKLTGNTHCIKSLTNMQYKKKQFVVLWKIIMCWTVSYLNSTNFWQENKVLKYIPPKYLKTYVFTLTIHYC